MNNFRLKKKMVSEFTDIDHFRFIPTYNEIIVPIGGVDIYFFT